MTDLAANFSHLALVDGATLLNGGLQVGAAHVFHDDEMCIRDRVKRGVFETDPQLVDDFFRMVRR